MGGIDITVFLESKYNMCVMKKIIVINAIIINVNFRVAIVIQFILVSIDFK